MRDAAFCVISHNKRRWASRAVVSALSQTYPCHILLSDYGSTDGTLEVMAEAVKRYERTNSHPHKVSISKCPDLGMKEPMAACTAHIWWLLSQTDAKWLFICPADDYSLPERVASCMRAVSEHDCATVSTSMYHLGPGQTLEGEVMTSGYGEEDGYIPAAEGLMKLGFGGTIAAYDRAFLEYVGPSPGVTPDVFYGFLAALDRGYYNIREPQHIYMDSPDIQNMGFGGRLLGADELGDDALKMQLDELNRFQLFEAYYACGSAMERLYPDAPMDAKAAVANMMLAQSIGWYVERKKLHNSGVEPISMMASRQVKLREVA